VAEAATAASIICASSPAGSPGRPSSPNRKFPPMIINHKIGDFGRIWTVRNAAWDFQPPNSGYATASTDTLGWQFRPQIFCAKEHVWEGACYRVKRRRRF
jgi:hypothetical protein